MDFDKTYWNIHSGIKPFCSSLPDQLGRLCPPQFYLPILTFSDPIYILYGHFIPNDILPYGHFLIHQICMDISLLWTIFHMVFLHIDRLCYKKIAQFHQKCSLMRDCSLFRHLLLPEYTVLGYCQNHETSGNILVPLLVQE